jgi:hypothetical protein
MNPNFQPPSDYTRREVEATARPAPLWDRGRVHGWIAEATGSALPVESALTDTLITRAQELGITFDELRTWVYLEMRDDRLRYRLLADALAAWACAKGLAHEGGGG